MRTSYHVHTVRSDGQSTFEQHVQGAIDQGLTELGFSDHYTLLPSGDQVWWSMPLGSLDGYFDEISKADELAAGKVIIRRGLEVDYFPGHAQAITDALQGYDFDYLIGSIHFVGDFAVDGTPEPWQTLTPEGLDQIAIEYWQRVREMAESGLFDIVGHLDVVRKFGITSSADNSSYIIQALDAIAQAGMVVELNTSGWHTPSGKAYPEPWILKECFARGIPTLITADAHEFGNLTRDFERAQMLLSELGFTSAVRFENRRRHTVNWHR